MTPIKYFLLLSAATACSVGSVEDREPLDDPNDEASRPAYELEELGQPAAWIGGGEATIASDGTSPIVTVAIRAPSDRAATVLVESRARIGVLEVVLTESRYALAAGEVREAALDLRPAFRMHAKQRDHVTRILTSVSLLDDDGRVVHRKRLPGRYLAVSAEGSNRVFCHETFAADYADGLTNDVIRARYGAQLQDPNRSNEHPLRIGSGIYRFTPAEGEAR
ncbi:MAG: hypothetical protein RMA76_15670 [Deltaproteobacteria bacterium]|jgi:hypothetical protein